MIATNKKKSIATLTFHHSEEDSFIVHIFNGSTLVTINELKEVMFIEKNGNQRKVKFMFRHVSDLTKFIVNDIFTKDSCLLPTVEELYFIHLELFRVFNSHLKKINNKQLKVCPIT